MVECGKMQHGQGRWRRWSELADDLAMMTWDPEAIVCKNGGPEGRCTRTALRTAEKASDGE
jgi:hypothetical protein